MGGILGFMKVVEGDAGSDRSVEEMVGGWIERPFMLRARLGDGEVMGRSNALPKSVTVSVVSMGGRPRPPKLGPG